MQQKVDICGTDSLTVVRSTRCDRATRQRAGRDNEEMGSLVPLGNLRNQTLLEKVLEKVLWWELLPTLPCPADGAA